MCGQHHRVIKIQEDYAKNKPLTSLHHVTYWTQQTPNGTAIQPFEFQAVLSTPW